MAAIAKSSKVLELEAKLAAAKELEASLNEQISAATAAGEDISGLKKQLKKAIKDITFATKGLKKAAKPAFGEAKKKKALVVEDVFVNKTPKGEKKDTSTPLGAYNPVAVEAAWADWWEAKGFYRADAEKAAALSQDEKFVIVIPPPNVTGSLHLGHALTCSIEDTIVRFQRMCGKTVLWLPGTDHAGIATQTVVEKKLMKTEGKTRHDLGREEFLKKVWEWKEVNGGHITKQLRRLGTSVDWSREVFTMDPNLSIAVTEAFVQMYERGNIFRASRLVNWCSHLNTAISNIEVDKLEIEDKPVKLKVPGHDPNKLYEFGTLTSFSYKVDGSDDEMVVATTRLETMLGDTAVACHPDDPRYKHLHGKFLIHPFRPETHQHYRIPVVLDPVLVDMSFGTGCVKITPAHDPNDFECGRRHGLDEVTIFNDDGSVNEHGGERFAGMMRFDARIAIEEALDELGLLKGKVFNKMVIPICSRSKDIIEPLVKPQWWVKMSEMGDDAIECVKNGSLELKPSFHNQTWFNWLTDCQDWCISRQLWWGHRIPAYLIKIAGETIADDNAYSVDFNNWVVARTKEDALTKAAIMKNVSADKIILEQDPDVLDTWFSSGLFPFSVMGWPNKDAADLKGFFPGHLLETGHDILFFWVARMVMMSRCLTGKLPFRTVYLHAMVRDKYGRKMSKSLGNVIDPLEVINGATLEELHAKIMSGNLPEHEVKKAIEGQKLEYPDGMPVCGADGLRFGLLSYTVQGRDVNLDVNRVFGYRKFCNKLWNMFKFADSMATLLAFKPPADLDTSIMSMSLSERDRWILNRCAIAARDTRKCIEEYQFGAACSTVYDFFMKEFCGVYLELVKPVLKEEGDSKLAAQATLYLCIDVGLRMTHPIMPFITEELYQRLPKREGDTTETISLANYPGNSEAMKSWLNDSVDEKVKVVLAATDGFMALRGEFLSGAYSGKRPNAYVICPSGGKNESYIKSQADDISTLAKLNSLTVLAASESAPIGCCTKLCGDIQVFLQLKGIVDFGKEVAKLHKETKKITGQMTILAKQMSSPLYENVPVEVRSRDQEKLDTAKAKVAAVEETLKMFEQLAM